MTSIFDKYAQYYDLLYKDKDYQSEVDYVSGLIKQHATKAKTILDMGCGSGVHASNFAKLGFSVHGVDQSKEMIKNANEIKDTLNNDIAKKLSFSISDVCELKLDLRFDVVVSLFHVVSYQVSNNDLQKMFFAAASHLNSGGVFVFDCWYGPAVLNDPPVVRVKRLNGEGIDILRIAEPEFSAQENVVDVNYEVYITDEKSRKTERINETHRMRYLFYPEIERMLSLSGLSLIDSQEWMSGKGLGRDTWYGCFIAKKI